jgi:hypothetical protein
MINEPMKKAKKEESNFEFSVIAELNFAGINSF